MEFQINDSDGQAHSYTVVLHNVDEGLAIVDRLIQAGLPALAAAVESVLRTDGGGGVVARLASGAGLAGAEQVLETLNLGSIGQQLAAAIPGLRVADLAPRLLARTSRDGKDLGNPANFNAAFRGNYGELLAASWKVIGLNRFLPRLGT